MPNDNPKTTTTRSGRAVEFVKHAGGSEGCQRCALVHSNDCYPACGCDDGYWLAVSPVAPVTQPPLPFRFQNGQRCQFQRGDYWHAGLFIAYATIDGREQCIVRTARELGRPGHLSYTDPVFVRRMPKGPSGQPICLTEPAENAVTLNALSPVTPAACYISEAVFRDNVARDFGTVEGGAKCG